MASIERLLEAVERVKDLAPADHSVLKRVIETTPKARIAAAEIYDQVLVSREENPERELDHKYKGWIDDGSGAGEDRKLKAIDTIARALKTSENRELPIDVIVEVLRYDGFPGHVQELVWNMISINDLDLTPERNFKLVSHGEDTHNTL